MQDYHQKTKGQFSAVFLKTLSILSCIKKFKKVYATDANNNIMNDHIKHYILFSTLWNGLPLVIIWFGSNDSSESFSASHAYRVRTFRLQINGKLPCIIALSKQTTYNVSMWRLTTCNQQQPTTKYKTDMSNHSTIFVCTNTVSQSFCTECTNKINSSKIQTLDHGSV